MYSHSDVQLMYRNFEADALLLQSSILLTSPIKPLVKYLEKKTKNKKKRVKKVLTTEQNEEEWLGTNFNRLIRNLHGWMEPLPLTAEEPQRLHKVKSFIAKLFNHSNCIWFSE